MSAAKIFIIFVALAIANILALSCPKCDDRIYPDGSMCVPFRKMANATYDEVIQDWKVYGKHNIILFKFLVSNFFLLIRTVRL
jgi:hypothetical protein